MRYVTLQQEPPQGRIPVRSASLWSPQRVWKVIATISVTVTHRWPAPYPQRIQDRGEKFYGNRMDKLIFCCCSQFLKFFPQGSFQICVQKSQQNVVKTISVNDALPCKTKICNHSLQMSAVDSLLDLLGYQVLVQLTHPDI